MSSSGFAVIDFETTGFSPNKGDKVVEIGLVLLDQHGEPESTFSTLINPGRDVGATRIHGITATDVMNAPSFAEVAPGLIHLLNGRVIVAHNASFDTNFLIAEFSASGIHLDKNSLPVICTMRLATEMLPGVGRSLSACCEAYDITIDNAHCALDDAIATAKLLRSYFDQEPNFSLWDEVIEQSSTYQWPSTSAHNSPTKQRGNVLQNEEPVLAKYITKLPDAAESPRDRGLLRLFDDIFSDGLMTPEEAGLIDAYVEEVGMDEKKLTALKDQYFLDLVNIAWSDGELNSAEIAGIHYVGKLMGKSLPEIKSKIEFQNDKKSDEAPNFAKFRIHLEEGDHIVLTGDMPLPRSHYEQLASDNGLICWPSVTKKVKVVIAQDSNTLSGKAKRARLIGIPVVGLEDFLIAIEESK
ncbi:MAG: hypothetical protein RI926_511 [Actinomycetota bacterium]|jgi:DNA polymerase-3 subunit epsilon